MSHKVTIFPDPRTVAWDPTDPGDKLDPEKHLFPTADLFEALKDTYSTRAMMGTWYINHPTFTSKEISFRVDKRAFKDPKWRQAVRFTALALDLDEPNHSTPSDDWYEDHIATAGAVGALLYTTSHGARLLWTLPEELGVEEFEEVHQKVHQYIRYLCPLGWDKSAMGLTRLYGLPHVRRDSGPYVSKFFWPNGSKSIDLDLFKIGMYAEAMDFSPEESDVPLRKPIRYQREAGEGERNNFLFRKACFYWSKGFGEEEVLAKLREHNAMDVTPPVEDDELEAVWQSAISYEGGPKEPPPAPPVPSIMSLEALMSLDDGAAEEVTESPTGDAIAQKVAVTVSEQRASGDTVEEHDAPLPDASGVTIALRTKSKLIGNGDKKSPIAFADGTYWKYSPKLGVWKELSETLVRAKIMDWWHGHDALNQKGATYPLTLGSGKVSDVMSCLETLVRVDSGEEFFSSRKPGVTFANGFVDETGELQEYSPDQRSRFRLSIDYCPNAAEPKLLTETLLGGCWKEMPDKDDMIQLFRECLGMSLVGKAPSLQKAFFLYGPGENGKSQVLDVVAGLFPEEVQCSISPQMLSEQYYVAQLPGKRLNLQAEVPKKAFTDSTGFKAAVDGSVMTGRHPAGRPFQVISEAAFWFASNHLPPTPDNSHGFWRRWQLFPFSRPIPKAEQVKDLGRRILEEEGHLIASWAISSVPGVLARGDYISVRSSNDLKSRWRGNVEPMSLFFTEEFLSEGEYKIHIPRTDLYRKYAVHADMSGLKVLSKADMYEHVREHYGARETKRSKWFFEIDLRHLVTDDVVEAAYEKYRARATAGDEVVLDIHQFVAKEGLNYGS